SGEKCLAKNCANRQQENREHKSHPSRRHGEDLGRGGEASWSCACNASDNFSAAFGFTPSAVVSRSSVSRSQTGPQITRIATNLEKRNLKCLGSTGCQPVHLASLVTLLAVSPRTPSADSTTFRFTDADNSTSTGLPSA